MSRIERLLARLRKFYGPLPSPPSDPFMLFVWEMMSWHSTPRKRDAAFAALKKQRALTPDAMWKTPQAKLEEIVRAVGPYAEQRLGTLRTGVDLFRRSRDLPAIIRGPVPAALKTLKPFPQMSGDSVAYRMLLFAGGHPVLPVDAKVVRTARRLGYGDPAPDFKRAARSIRQALAKEIAATSDAYRDAYLYLSHHGDATCTQGDPHCSVCPLLEECPEGKTRAGRLEN